MSDAKAHMWVYYTKKYQSRVAALETLYPDLLAARPDIAQAVNNIKIAEGFIDNEMDKLQDTP